jgi:rubredoxin
MNFNTAYHMEVSLPPAFDSWRCPICGSLVWSSDYDVVSVHGTGDYEEYIDEFDNYSCYEINVAVGAIPDYLKCDSCGFFGFEEDFQSGLEYCM